MKHNKDRLVFTWEVDDGYAGGSAPQHTTVDLCEFDGCDTIEDAVAVVEAAIEDDFRNHANPIYDTEKISEIIKAAWKPEKE